jgi:hypothetical protein
MARVQLEPSNAEDQSGLAPSELQVPEQFLGYLPPCAAARLAESATQLNCKVRSWMKFFSLFQ